MKNATRLLVFVGALSALCLFSGCDENQSMLFDRAQVSAGVVQEDSIQLSNGQLVALASLPVEARELVDPAKVLKAGTEVTEEQVTVKPVVQTAVKAISYLPFPYADVVGAAVGGILSIFAGWQTRRAGKMQKLAVAGIQTIDTVRDILDQTPGGRKIDAQLKEVAIGHQAALGVLNEASALVQRYRTPDKPERPEASLDMDAILAELRALKAAQPAKAA